MYKKIRRRFAPSRVPSANWPSPFSAACSQRHRTGQIAGVAGIVVLAEPIFTVTAALSQPITGYLLTRDAEAILSEQYHRLYL
ncbi:DUF2269 family protein [Cypionkella sp.]|uniref:DUF2269 family protein n=1 Tax=Cypionkella sp. TaxID=2811411 RepID=UPI0027288FC5|nr:DUF2269 family protein [Cypionkella sp.]MDO8982397.1 DUF2269 family protein [Cypionkella sp.]MDP2050648.1 DUF2269 family protein [Cypionkella sp.]